MADAPLALRLVLVCTLVLVVPELESSELEGSKVPTVLSAISRLQFQVRYHDEAVASAASTSGTCALGGPAHY